MAQSLRTGHVEQQVLEARKRIEEQEARLRRLIAQGAPTQSAEDLLCKLHHALQEVARHARSSHSLG